jgi:DNA-binding SARP family transcriptional activator
MFLNGVIRPRNEELANGIDNPPHQRHPRGAMLIELRTFENVELTSGADGNATALVAQPKRFSLLCYLAIPKPGMMYRRDALLGIFWPEGDSERTRMALRQALAHIRKALGHDVILRRGSEEVGLKPEHFWCDVTAFEQALDDREWAAATELYRGEFLKGLFVANAPEFDNWLETERTRLAGRYAHALAQLAEAATAAGQTQAAVEQWRRLVLHDGYDSRNAMGLMKALERAGDPAHALLHAREHRGLLRRELDIAPSSEFEALVERIQEKTTLVKSFGGTRPSTAARDPKVAVVAVAAMLVFVLFGFFGVPNDMASWLSQRFAPPGPNAEDLDSRAVAVFPFRIGGADLSLWYLQEGIVDLLAAKLTGDGGPRALDPRSIVNAWNELVSAGEPEPSLDASLHLAARLNAGQAVIGSVVGTQRQMTIEASLFEVKSGRETARAEVTGSADSILYLTDELTARLLASQIESTDPAIEALSSVLLPALKAYIAGRAASRRGSYEEAVSAFRLAVQVDSNFALAWLGLLDVAIWSVTPGLVDQARANTWRLRERLSARDRAVVMAFVGPNYPQAPPTTADHFVGWEHALTLAPERPESWFHLGDFPLFHHGRLLGLTDSHERATAAFERAVDLDGAYVAPLEHLIELAIQIGDTVSATTLGEQYFALDTTAALSDFLKWHLTFAFGDGQQLDSIRTSFDRMSSKSLQRIIGTAQLVGRGLDDALRAASVLHRRAATSGERQETLAILHDFAMNRGRPVEAQDALERADLPDRERLRRRIEDLLYWNPEFGVGQETADQLSQILAESPGEDAPMRAARFQDMCALEQWRLSQNDTTSFARTVATLRSAAYPDDIPWAAVHAGWCATLLETVMAVKVRKAGEESALSALDSMNLMGSWILPQGNLVLARLWASRGNLDSALAVVRRRPYHWREVQYLTSFLREEGRMAVAVGELDVAVRAYEHYLALRGDPDHSVVAEVEEVQRELTQLRGGN